MTTKVSHNPFIRFKLA